MVDVLDKPARREGRRRKGRKKRQPKPKAPPAATPAAPPAASLSPRKQTLMRHKLEKSPEAVFEARLEPARVDEETRVLADLNTEGKVSLFRHGSARIVDFQEQLHKELQALGTLLGHGSLEIFQLHSGTVTYLACGRQFVYPLLPKLRILRTSRNQFVLPLVNPERFWKIHLEEATQQELESLEEVLKPLVKYTSLDLDTPQAQPLEADRTLDPESLEAAPMGNKTESFGVDTDIKPLNGVVDTETLKHRGSFKSLAPIAETLQDSAPDALQRVVPAPSAFSPSHSLPAPAYPTSFPEELEEFEPASTLPSRLKPPATAEEPRGQAPYPLEHHELHKTRKVGTPEHRKNHFKPFFSDIPESPPSAPVLPQQVYEQMPWSKWELNQKLEHLAQKEWPQRAHKVYPQRAVPLVTLAMASFDPFKEEKLDHSLMDLLLDEYETNISVTRLVSFLRPPLRLMLVALAHVAPRRDDGSVALDVPSHRLLRLELYTLVSNWMEPGTQPRVGTQSVRLGAAPRLTHLRLNYSLLQVLQGSLRDIYRSVAERPTAPARRGLLGAEVYRLVLGSERRRLFW